MIQDDLFDLIRAGDPAPSAAVPGTDSVLGRSVLATVMANATSPDARRRRRLVAIAMAVLLSVVAAAGIAWALNTREVTNSGSVLCYDSPSTDASAIEVPRAEIANSDECAALWQSGVLPVDSSLPRGQIPPLVACVSSSGTLVVFPSDDPRLCSVLGLADQASQSPGADSVVVMRNQLVEEINSATCLTLDQAKILVADTFVSLGLDDWLVRAKPENSERPCASLAIDDATRVVILVPIPDPDQ